MSLDFDISDFLAKTQASVTSVMQAGKAGMQDSVDDLARIGTPTSLRSTRERSDERLIRK
ncbi:hypothetical protein P7H12_26065 [Paenibacillus larvae]|nr:hypothetical protein [Paenibacillus larvae]MDT2266379.1 hypothetical protein [Paenibacillus larvae]